MRFFCVVFLVFSLSLWSTASGQDAGDRQLKIFAEVLEIPESSFDTDVDPPKGAVVIIRYKVLNVLRGLYKDTEIRIAHGIASRRILKRGDKVVLVAKSTSQFRDAAEHLRAIGVERGQQSIADFIFVKFKTTPRSSHPPR